MGLITEPQDEPNLKQILLISSKIVEEELDESLFFLELIVEFNSDKRNKIALLYKEAEEILRIIVASLKTLENEVKCTK